MARSIQEILDVLITEKETFAELNTLEPLVDSSQKMLTELTTSSKVGVWRLWLWVIAVSTWVHEKLWDEFKADVEQTALDAIPGTARWYVIKAKEFQNGFLLEWDDDKQKAVYSDTTSLAAQDSRIVTQSAATTANGGITLKVAKGEIGSLVPLSASEETALKQYFEGHGTTRQGVGFAGVVLTLVNVAADDIRMAIEVFFDPLVIELDSSAPPRAQLILDTSKHPIEEAIENYVQTINFNSEYRILDMVDEIQAATGVDNVVILNVDGKQNTQASGSYEDITAASGQKRVAVAGYMVVDTDFALDDFYDAPTDTIKSITYTSVV